MAPTLSEWIEKDKELFYSFPFLKSYANSEDFINNECEPLTNNCGSFCLDQMENILSGLILNCKLLFQRCRNEWRKNSPLMQCFPQILESYIITEW